VPQGFGMDGFVSVPYVKFHNGVSVLSSSGMQPGSLSDLGGKKVVAFAGADSILPGVADAKSSMKSYTEKSDQLSQSRLLFAGRADAVLGDGLIFAEYNAQLREEAKNKKLPFDPNQEVSFYAIFDPTPYTMVFRSDDIQKDFDRCYGELKANGTIEAINTKYVDMHRDVVGTEYQGL
ncbi:MAG: transporter substrate-binding domain-containing protein, partial [Alphaproteobacteria bacterium]|nr:transporter substrate-binding domain-containing protein [Alphaproteobacteria bacterium]